MSALVDIIDTVDQVSDDPTAAGAAAMKVAHPESGRKVIDYLEARFVRLEPQEHPMESTPIWWDMLLLVAAQWGDAERAAFRARIGLACPTPDAYRWLAPFVRAGFPVAEVEPWVLLALESGAGREQVNASHLAYHLFGEGYELSEAGKVRLAAADPLGATPQA